MTLKQSTSNQLAAPTLDQLFPSYEDDYEDDFKDDSAEHEGDYFDLFLQDDHWKNELSPANQGRKKPIVQMNF